MAALVILLACAATARFRRLGYVALAAGIALALTWLVRPPSDLWIAAHSYPRPAVAAPPFSRVALFPAFQPIGLRAGGGNGADPDAFIYPGNVPALNEYLPTYPVDMALARYEQTGDVAPLRALGVAQLIARPWLVSHAQGGIGVAALSLQSKARSPAATTRFLFGATPLMSECDAPNLVRFEDRLGDCDVFFGDAAQHTTVRPVAASSDSIDPTSAWIDARLVFVESPALAQAIGGAVTQSRLPLSVEPGSWLLAYVAGELRASNGETLAHGPGAFAWLRVPPDVASVECLGVCELVAQTSRLPNLPVQRKPNHLRALTFSRLAAWLYIVERPDESAHLLRFNERYDSAWTAFEGWRALPHVRVDMSVNGWLLESTSDRVILVQMTALLQLIAEIIGALCVLWLLKALAWPPTKRAR
jgi:hypothetical protein